VYFFEYSQSEVHWKKNKKENVHWLDEYCLFFAPTVTNVTCKTRKRTLALYRYYSFQYIYILEIKEFHRNETLSLLHKTLIIFLFIKTLIKLHYKTLIKLH